MPDRIFTLKDWKKIKQDIFDDYFVQHNVEHDLKELMDAGLMGTPESEEPTEDMVE